MIRDRPALRRRDCPEYSERSRIVQHFAVAITENVRRIPAVQSEHTCLERRREHRFHQSLPGLEVFATDRDVVIHRELLNRGNVYRQVRRAVSKRDSTRDARPRIEHGRRNRGVVLLHPFDQFFRR